MVGTTFVVYNEYIMNKLFNPFRYLPRRQLSCWGIAMMILTAIYCWLLPLRATSLTQVMILQERPRLWVSTVEQLTIWLSFTVVLYIIGVLFSRSKVSLQDVAVNNLFARMPMDFMLLLFAAPQIHSVMLKLQDMVLDVEQMTVNIGQYVGPIGIVSIVGIIAAIWYFFWSYKAFAEATNLRNGKGVVLFVLGYVLAMMLSGWLLPMVQ